MLLDREPIVFRSRVDGWIAAVVLGAIALSVLAMIEAHRTDPIWSWWPMVFLVVLLAGVLAFSVPIRYVLTETELIVRAGVTQTRIALDRIERVEPTRNPLAAPAMSLNRLRIDYGGGVFGYTLISPEDPDMFVELLAERAGLTRSESGLVREGV